MRWLVFTALAMPLIIAISVSGCGDDELAGVGVDLSGTYELEQATIGDEVVTPPEATGTAVLTANTYSVNISIFLTGSGLVQITDQGTYTTSGNEWMQESLDTGTPSVGTFSVSGDLLTVSTTFSGFQIEAVWRRTG